MATRRTQLALLALALTAPCALHAQADVKPDAKPDAKPAPAPPSDINATPPQYPSFIHNRTQASDYRQSHNEYHTFYLKNVSQPNDGNEILTGLRLMLEPSVKMYLLPSQNALAMQILPTEVPIVEKFLAEWDRPHRLYRLTYAITESDDGKRIGIQHVSIDCVSGLRCTLKNGSKVPVATGSYNNGSNAGSAANSVQTQFTYLDVGLSLDATLYEMIGGAQLKSKIEQSSIVDVPSAMGKDDPIVRQTQVDGVTNLAPGKPLNIGGIDVPGSTRHIDIEVTLQPL